jgi:hypothetical protein
MKYIYIKKENIGGCLYLTQGGIFGAHAHNGGLTGGAYCWS